MVKLAGAIAALALAAGPLTACSPAETGAALSQTSSSTQAAQGAGADNSATTEERRHPVSNLRIIPVTVTGGGETITFETELADTPEAQSRGLMFRTELADDEAMIFPTDTPQQRSFWMKNTPLPLDIIFVGPDGTITNIAANTVPYSLDSVPSAGLAIAVLEIRGGLAAELGIEPGDTVTWDAPEG